MAAGTEGRLNFGPIRGRLTPWSEEEEPMRLAVLLGMSVLGLSGAVAYGAIADMSRQRSAAAVALPVAAVRMPAEATGFATAGLVTFHAPKAEPVRAATGLVAVDPRMLRPVPVTFSLRPKARPDAPAKRTRALPPVAAQPAPRPATAPAAPARRAFRMPWQTGIFQ
jgi:hypothetical protein